jgi:hypothetical protein
MILFARLESQLLKKRTLRMKMIVFSAVVIKA